MPDNETIRVISWKYCWKKDIANAYGFSTDFLARQLKAATKKKKDFFGGEVFGRRLLTPAQTKAIVTHLGDPADWERVATIEK